MAHPSMNDYWLARRRAREERAMEEARERAREEAENPTGWGPLPWEPSANDRAWNTHWDNLYGPWREEHWETVPTGYVNEDGTEETIERLRDPMERERYEWRERMITEYDDALRWRRERIHRRDYDARKAQIEEVGLGKVHIMPQFTDRLFSLRVQFPRNFYHLTNAPTQRAKENTKEGYHISISYRGELQRRPDHLAKMNAFLRKHFGMRNGVADVGKYGGADFNLRHIRVSNRGGVYELVGNSQFERELNELAREGTGKGGAAHISLT